MDYFLTLVRSEGESSEPITLFQEYEEEISSLSSELASARDQNGVFLSTEKYQALMDQMNRQKIAIDQEKVKKCLI